MMISDRTPESIASALVDAGAWRQLHVLADVLHREILIIRLALPIPSTHGENVIFQKVGDDDWYTRDTFTPPDPADPYVRMVLGPDPQATLTHLSRILSAGPTMRVTL